jgi:hypothetical protein
LEILCEKSRVLEKLAKKLGDAATRSTYSDGPIAKTTSRRSGAAALAARGRAIIANNRSSGAQEIGAPRTSRRARSALKVTAASVGRQPRFGQALRDSLDVLFSIERESADMAGERVARIDRFEFVPEAPRFFDLADMTEGGGEERSG